MGKIDFSEAEKQISDSIQKMRIKSLVEGKTVNSSHSKEFYGLEGEEMRPAAQDPVIIMLSQEAAKEEQHIEEDPFSDEEQQFLNATSARALLLDVMVKIPPQSGRIPQKIPPKYKDIAPSEKYLERSSALYTLRQHILWLKKNHIEDRYERLGATMKEVLSYRVASKLTDKELARIKELNKRAEAIISELLKKKEDGNR